MRACFSRRERCWCGFDWRGEFCLFFPRVMSLLSSSFVPCTSLKTCYEVLRWVFLLLLPHVQFSGFLSFPIHFTTDFVAVVLWLDFLFPPCERFIHGFSLHMTYKVEICDMIQIYLRSIPIGWQHLKKHKKHWRNQPFETLQTFFCYWTNKPKLPFLHA